MSARRLRRRPAATTPWPFPGALRRPGRRLLHQQCWCWGADIRRPAGNLLLEYGMTRTRATTPGLGMTSRYTWADATGRRVQLWGWGLLYAVSEVGAIFLDRHDFLPLVSHDPAAGADAFEARHLQGLVLPRTPQDATIRRALLVDACLWIAQYEAWVAARAGLEYRRDVVNAWKRIAVPADEVCTAWTTLATSADALLATATNSDR